MTAQPTTPVITTLVDVLNIGLVVASEGMVYLLTPCCVASGKGGESGVICRACHRPVDDRYGWATMASWGKMAEDALAEILEPVLEDHAATIAQRAIAKAASLA
jgi:hypothetical protein